MNAQHDGGDEDEGASGSSPNAQELAEYELPLFREAALRARGESSQDLVRAPVLSEWSLLLSLASFVLLAGCLLCFAKIEVTTTAYGALRTEQGPRPIVTQVSGRVAQLAVTRGSHVETGQELARIDAPELVGRLQRQEAQYRHVKLDTESALSGSQQADEDIAVALRRKRALLVERSVLVNKIVQHRKQAEKSARALADAGAGRALDTTEAAIVRRQSEQEWLLVRQQVAEIDVELAQRRKATRSEKLELTARVTAADSDLRETRELLELSAVRSPERGTVESLLAIEGQVVTAGTPIARVVPEGPIDTLVAFAPAKDAPFLQPGQTANVELSALPVAEFGKLEARIRRVSTDLSSPEEQVEVLGADANPQASVRVELVLVQGPKLERVRSRLTSGGRATVRLSTRRVRLVVLLFDFTRKWVTG
ncbi:MAG TPA: HlyD family efflux transporter periplasmic adaptor subunit [Polyangiaceae bacterium]|nr:HlyD family efflux transporter periplasmic adaptor subunit [Polyangiaceae bacterium]